MAILQVGYERNKAGYKFTEIEDAFRSSKSRSRFGRLR